MAPQTEVVLPSALSLKNDEETLRSDTLTIVVGCDSESEIENKQLESNSGQCNTNPPSQPSSPSKSPFNRVLSLQSKTLMLILTVLALVIASISLWPSISSTTDGKRATLLAEWEAEKDFLEFCESVRTLPPFTFLISSLMESLSTHGTPRLAAQHRTLHSAHRQGGTALRL